MTFQEERQISFLGQKRKKWLQLKCSLQSGAAKGFFALLSGNHSFEFQWCHEHLWLGANGAKLAVLGGWGSILSSLSITASHVCM